MLAATLLAALALLLVYARRLRRARDDLAKRLEAAARDLEALQGAFARFAPAEVVEEIASQGVSTRPAKKDVTVLFADLKAFTALAERLEPAVLVRVLNGYFERMSRAIDAHRGHLTKFIGDGFLAVFGALEANPWQTNDAAHAALALQAALADYNTTLAAEGLPALAMGVGIHRGAVVAGVMGSAQLVEYGVFGRTVNLAARVERLTRVHGTGILVTAAVRDMLDPRFRMRAFPPRELKGIPEPVATFALEGFDEGV